MMGFSACRERLLSAISGLTEVSTKHREIDTASNQKRSIVGATKKLEACIGLAIFIC